MYVCMYVCMYLNEGLYVFTYEPYMYVCMYMIVSRNQNNKMEKNVRWSVLLEMLNCLRISNNVLTTTENNIPKIRSSQLVDSSMLQEFDYFGVYMYVCMYVRLYVCMYVCIYVCMHMDGWIPRTLECCLFLLQRRNRQKLPKNMYFKWPILYVCVMYVCMSVCMYICMYVLRKYDSWTTNGHVCMNVYLKEWRSVRVLVRLVG